MFDSPAERPFKIYQSSAGSGKTYTLVKEYISIVLKSDNPNKFRQILAITFTNKAATEMKERVLKALLKLSKDADADLMKDFVASTGIKKPELISKSSKAYNNIIHQYGDFNILTIDKFVHRIIRSFARELDLSLSFEIETDIDTFLQRSIGVLLNNIGADEELTKYLIRFSEQLIEESGKGDIEKQLLRLTSILKNEKTRIPLADFEKHDLAFFSDLGKKVKENEKKLILEVGTSISKIVDLLSSQGLGIDFFKGKMSSGWGALINKSLTKDEFTLTDPTIKQYHEETWYTPKTESLVRPIISPLQDEMGKLIKINEELNFAKEFNKQLVGFSLLNSIHQILFKVKSENNIVFISDFNEVISKIVINEPAPFIYEKIGARYKNYLIDEFQDTSSLQWTNLVPLVYESLSEGNKNLIVGDSKQAIYRWRNGDVHQFVNLPKVEGEFTYLDEINAVFNYSAKRKVLQNNYRSASAIVKFNNWLFEALAVDENEQVQKIYNDSSQNVTKKQTGFVNAKIIGKDIENVDKIVCQNVLQYVEQAKLNGFSDGDIALLVRSKNDGMTIAAFLKEQGYPVVSSDSIVLGSSKDVSFIVSFLQAFGDDKNEHAAIKCLDYLKEEPSLTKEYDNWRIPDKKNAYYTKGIDLKKYLSGRHPIFKQTYYLSLNLYDKIIYLIQSFKMNRYDPFLDQLLNTVHHYLKRNTSSIQLFVEFYENKKESISVNLGSVDNAIQVMTIHKSKGLQFPVVIIPFAKWQNTNPGMSNLTWIEHEKLDDLNLPKYVTPLTKSSLKNYNLEKIAEKEEAEAVLDNLNLYYVAFTRAVDRLYILFEEPRSKGSVTSKIINQVASHSDFNEDAKELVSGDLEPNKKKRKQKEEVVKGVEVISKRESLNLSFDRNAHIEEFNTISEREKGIAIHAVLSEINSKNDIEVVANQLEVKGIVPSSIKSEIIVLINKLFNIPQVASWFNSSSEVYNEQEIISKDGHFYIPDKVITKGLHAIVIDYKTGKSLTKHTLQITEYGNLLEEMGYTHIEKYLLYINNQKIVTV